jgi:hypothetical protein
MIVEINLPQTTIKKIIQYALAIENGNRPAKIRSLLIDKKDNFTGPLDSTLVVSAFKVK